MSERERLETCKYAVRIIYCCELLLYYARDQLLYLMNDLLLVILLELSILYTLT